jgi:endonuclease YncB( thermonuclease family)
MGNCINLASTVKQDAVKEPTLADRFLSAYLGCNQYCMNLSVSTEVEEKDVYRHHTDDLAPGKIVVPENVYHSCTYENTPAYTYEHLRKLVKVLRVLDGDTVDIALQEESGKIFKHRVRLYGIDTPEKRPSASDPEREKEIAASKKSSEALTDKLKENDNMVIALFYKPDKYGRLMCTFYDKQGDDINQWMVTSGFAYEYFGKTKKTFHEVSEKKTIVVSECDNDYFETPRKESEKTEETDVADDFEEIEEMS